MNGDERKNLRDLLNELDRYFEDFEKEVQDNIRGGIGSMKANPFVAGFSFRLGPSGKPTVQFFGDSPLRSDGFRSPMSEQIFDEKNGLLRLVMDLPGVEKKDIKVDATYDRAVITAEKVDRKYRAELELKAEVKPETGKAEYRNGVLEISFSLKDKANKDYRRVDIV